MDEEILLSELELELLEDVEIPEDEDVSEDKAADATEAEESHLNRAHRLSLECRGENNHRINNLYMIVVYWI